MSTSGTTPTAGTARIASCWSRFPTWRTAPGPKTNTPPSGGCSSSPTTGLRPGDPASNAGSNSPSTSPTTAGGRRFSCPTAQPIPCWTPPSRPRYPPTWRSSGCPSSNPMRRPCPWSAAKAPSASVPATGNRDRWTDWSVGFGAMSCCPTPACSGANRPAARPTVTSARRKPTGSPSRPSSPPGHPTACT